MADERRGPPGALSATQVDTFELCPRKWGLRKIDRIEAPPNKYAEFGVRGHAQHEAYLGKGVPYNLTLPEGEAACSGIHLLPLPGTPGLEIETPFVLNAWGHQFFGLKDVQILNRVIGTNVLQRFPIVEQIDPYRGKVVPLVLDHKFTGDLKWAKTSDELRENIQAALYAADAMLRAGTDVCDLRWIYYKRAKPFRAQATDVRVTREELTPTLVKIRKLSDEIREIKSSGIRGIDLPPNPNACGAYGGCPYVKICNLTPLDQLSAVMSNSTPSNFQDAKSQFLANLRAQQGAAGAPAPAINPPQGAPQFQPPPAGAPAFQPPPQAAPPPTPPPAPAAPQIDPQVLAQAQMSHPNWTPGSPWWNGAGYVNPGDPAYPPVYVAASQAAPPPAQAAPPPGAMPPPANPEPAAEEGKGKPGRPKKNQEAIDLAAEGLDRIAEGFRFVASALKKGLL